MHKTEQVLQRGRWEGEFRQFRLIDACGIVRAARLIGSSSRSPPDVHYLRLYRACQIPCHRLLYSQELCQMMCTRWDGFEARKFQRNSGINLFQQQVKFTAIKIWEHADFVALFLKNTVKLDPGKLQTKPWSGNRPRKWKCSKSKSPLNRKILSSSLD